MTHINGHRNSQVSLETRPDVARVARPADLVQVDGKPVHKKAAEVFEEMKKAAAKDGVQLQVVSGYRSDAEQAQVYAEKGPGLAAPPGSSRHRTGLAIDIGPPSAYGWLAENAKNFGFAKTVAHEPWHFELTGVTNGGEVTDYSDSTPSTSGGSSGGAANSADANAVGGGSSPSGMSLGGGGRAGGASGVTASGGSASGGSSGASAGSSSGPSSGTSVVSAGSSVAKGDFGALLKKLKAMGIDEEYLKELSEKYGVPVEVMLAVMMQESGGNPNAKSPAGALGLMQLMPGTAAGLGVKNPLDPKQNLEGGVKYLAEMKANPRSGGDWGKAFAMYNAGPAGNFNNPETQGYIRSVPQLVEQARQALA